MLTNGRAVEQLYAETPLLGYRAFLPGDTPVSRDQVSRFLDPLKKHLLMADSVFIRDNFCFGFDSVADSVSRNRWREDPNVVNLVELSVERIRAFLSILAELKDFIVSGALVFMPYFVTPTLPYRNVPAKLQRHIDRLRVADPSGRIWGHSIPVGDFDKVLVPWLNARLHELDPVYLSDEMARIGSTLRFDSDPAQPPPATDLLSVNILPFGGADQNDLDTLWKMRRNESVFSHI